MKRLLNNHGGFTPESYRGLSLADATLLRWPNATRERWGAMPPRSAFDDGTYSAFRRDWFISQGAEFRRACCGSSRRPWFVMAPYIGGSGDFNLDDSRGRLRRFANPESAGKVADALNEQAKAFRTDP